MRPGDAVRVLPSGKQSTGRAHRHAGRRSRRGRRRPVGHADARRRDRHQPWRRPLRGRRSRRPRRPVRGEHRLDERGRDAAGPPLSGEARRDDARRLARPAEVRRRRQHAGSSRRAHAAPERDRRLQPDARSRGRVRRVRGQPRHGQLHRHRPLYEPDGRRRSSCTSRCAARRTSTGRRPRSTRMRARGRTAIARACSGSPAYRAAANRRSRTSSSASCTRSACARTCSTATTSAMG